MANHTFIGKEDDWMGEAWKHIRAYLLAAAFLLMLGIGAKAEAAQPVQGLGQTESGTDYVKVKWDALIADGVYYKAELAGDMGFSSAKTEETSVCSAAFNNLSPGKTYYVRVTAYKNGNGSNVFGVSIKPLSVVTVPEVSSTQNLRQTAATSTGITVKWNKNPGANAYRLEYCRSGSSGSRNVVRLEDVRTYTATNLGRDEEYEFHLYPERKSASGYRASAAEGHSVSGCPVLPGKVEGLTASFSSPSVKTLDLSWDRRSNADGYQYEIYTLAGKDVKKLLGSKKCENDSGVDVSSNKLVKPQFLKARVRAYVVLGSGTKYGAWSGWTYTSKQPEIKIANVRSGQRISWKKVGGADSYTLYVSSKRENGYKKVKTLSKNSVTVKKYGRSALKSGKTYYYIAVANKKIGRKTLKGCKTHCYSRAYYN